MLFWCCFCALHVTSGLVNFGVSAAHSTSNSTARENLKARNILSLDHRATVFNRIISTHTTQANDRSSVGFGMATTNQLKGIEGIPGEIFNIVLELVVTRRSPDTGEQLPIVIQDDFIDIIKVTLPASQTCKSFTIITPMFFGLNIFDIRQRSERYGYPGASRQSDRVKLSGLSLLESGWIWDCAVF